MHASIHHATAFAAMLTGSVFADTCNVLCMADRSMHDDHHPMHVTLLMEKVCKKHACIEILILILALWIVKWEKVHRNAT